MSDLRLVNNEWILEKIPDADALDWITIDLGDGSWTQSDPTSFILSGASTTNEITTISLNEVTSSSEAYSFQNGANFQGPRWYKNLETTKNEIINSDDAFAVFFQIVVEAPDTKDKNSIFLGFSEDPTSTVCANINFFGTILEYGSTTANPAGGYAIVLSGGNASAAATANANLKMAVNNIEATGNRLGATPVINLDSSGAYLSERSVNINNSLNSSTDLSIVVMAGTNGTVTMGDSDIKAKLRYRVVKFESLPL